MQIVWVLSYTFTIFPTDIKLFKKKQSRGFHRPNFISDDISNNLKSLLYGGDTKQLEVLFFGVIKPYHAQYLCKKAQSTY